MPHTTRRFLLPIALLALAAAAAAQDAVMVPGGPASIRRLLGQSPERPNSDFFLEIHEALLFGSPEDAGWASVVARRRIVAFAEDLAAWRGSFGDPAAFSAAPAEAWSRCARALDWLGFDVEGAGTFFVARRRPDAASLRRQSFLDALGVPTRVFLAGLRAGKTVTVSAPDGPAPLPFGLAAWRETVVSPELTPDGAFLFFVRHVPASRMLVALHGLDPPTREQLRPGGDPARESWKWLFENALDSFVRHPEALRLRDRNVVLPGGAAADPIWADVFRAAPGSSALFTAFYKTGGGKAAYVVETFEDLREEQSRPLLFGGGGAGTKDPVPRFRALYDAVDSGGRNYGLRRRDPYDFAHLAPFLGQAGARWVPRGLTLEGAAIPRDEAELAALAAREPAAASSPEETALRLFGPLVPGSPVDRISARRRFLYLSGLMGERPALADPRLAVLLDRGFDRYAAAYAPLEDFPFSGPEPAILYVFALDRLGRRAPSRESELAAGLFQTHVAALAEMARSGGLAPARAEGLLHSLLDVPLFSGEDVSPAQGESGLFAWLSDALLPALGGGDAAAEADADDALTRALVGSPPSAPVEWRGGLYRFDLAQDEAARRRAFLSRQSLTSVEDLQTLHRERAALAGAVGRGDLEAARIAAGELSRGLRLEEQRPSARSLDERLDEEEESARAAVRHLEGLRKPADLAASAPWIAALDLVLAERHLEAFLGHVYAISAGDPDDLYYEDPYFVRRHSFRTVERGGVAVRTAFTGTALERESAGGGSRICGSVFGLPDVLGLLHADQLAYRPGARVPTEEIRSKLVAPIRRMCPGRLDEESLRIVAASGRATGEFARALTALPVPERFAAWNDLARDLVPASRLWPVAGMDQPDDGLLSQYLSASDLYRIGRRIAKESPAAPAPLPAADEARAALSRLETSRGAEGARARLAEFGPHAETFAGRLGLADADMPAYERLAAYRRPQVFGERLYDLKIAVAFRVAEAGLPASILPLVLPAALDATLVTLNLTQPYDWRGAIRAAFAFSRADLDRILDEAVRDGRLVRVREAAMRGRRSVS